MREVIRWALLLLGLAAASCDLGRADVVTRPPGLGPAITVPPAADAADVAGPDAAADNGTNADAGLLSGDGRADRAGGADVSLGRDGRDAPAEKQNDTPVASSDTVCAGEAGGECGAAGLVMSDDFEDGAAGWMSTGIIWAVTADPTSAQPNSVLSPTGSAASSVYYSSGAWQDMTAEVRLRVTSFGRVSSANRAEIYARYQNAGHFYALGVRSDQHLVLRHQAGSLGSAAVVSVPEGEWHVLKIKVSGPASAVTLEGYIDGVLMVTATDPEGSLPSALGTVGVGIYGETMAVFDDVRVSSP